MKHLSKITLATTVALAGSIGAAFAGTDETPIIETPPAPAASSWTFEGTMYGWLTGLDGDVGADGLTVGFDESFLDIFDDINMAAALRFEARNNRWGIIADGFYVDLGASGTPPGPLYNNANAELQQFIGELSVAYRLYESPSGFVDVYAGARYNNLSVDLNAVIDPVGIQTASADAGERVVDGIDERADEIVQPKVAAFQSGSAARRTAIENKVTAAIVAEADGRVKRDLEKQLIEIRRHGGLDARTIAADKISLAVKAERLKLARTTARLEVAKLRASVDASLQGKVTQARARVAQAEQQLSTAINNQLVNNLPTGTSDDVNWLDPIIGLRAQWNINDKWFLAGKSDIGGFDVGSELAWTFQATVGYNFTQRFSTELGYRYLHTDYTNDSFVYDVAQAGLYVGFNYKF